MRYIAMQKSVASKEPRFCVSARFLLGNAKGLEKPSCERKTTDHICDSLSTGSLDLIKTSLALSPVHVIGN